MKTKHGSQSGVRDLCRKLKLQLDELSVELEKPAPLEENNQRIKLMEQLKQQIAELSS